MHITTVTKIQKCHYLPFGLCTVYNVWILNQFNVKVSPFQMWDIWNTAALIRLFFSSTVTIHIFEINWPEWTVVINFRVHRTETCCVTFSLQDGNWIHCAIVQTDTQKRKRFQDKQRLKSPALVRWWLSSNYFHAVFEAVINWSWGFKYIVSQTEFRYKSLILSFITNLLHVEYFW